jgi:hypothetical protein
MIFSGNEDGPNARLISVRVWAKNERQHSFECFGYLIVTSFDRPGEGFMEHVRMARSDRKVFDALSEEERERLYQEAWRVYNDRPAGGAT